MASGTHTTSNGYLTFIARCSVSDLLVASASYNLWCNLIQQHTSFINITELLGRLHRNVFNRVSFSISKYLSMVSLVKQSIFTLAVGSYLQKESCGRHFLNCPPKISSVCHLSSITSHTFSKTNNLLPSPPLTSLSNIYKKKLTIPFPPQPLQMVLVLGLCHE